MTQISRNMICPNSGKPVKPDTIAEYQGQFIGFCNQGCRDHFQNHPEDHPHILAEYFPVGRLRTHDATQFQASKDWGKKYIANINGVGVRLHSCESPYIWHKNDGQEVFVVLDGIVEMRYERKGERYKSTLLTPGMIAHMEEGCEHVAHPQGLARVLVIEMLGSV